MWQRKRVAKDNYFTLPTREKDSKHQRWLRRSLCAWPVSKGDVGMAEAGEEDVQKEHLHGCISSDG